MANACGEDGAAGQLSDELTALGFDVESPVDSGLNTREQQSTEVYFVGDNDRSTDVATSVYRALKLSSGEVLEAGVPAPTRSGGMDGADVLILLGCDIAGTPLADLS